jgi:hypothetical protein
MDLIKRLRERSAGRRDIICQYGEQDSICDLLDEAADALEKLEIQEMELYYANAQNGLYKDALNDDGRG